jgi:hypothetical protein
MLRSAILTIGLFFGSTKGADPCTLLCDHEGPAVCTRGSWAKNGVCHGYYFVNHPSLLHHCYHTSESARACPDQEKTPLTVKDASDFLTRYRSGFNFIMLSNDYMYLNQAPVSVVFNLNAPTMELVAALLDDPSIELLRRVMRMEDIDSLEILEGIHVSGERPDFFNCHHTDVDADPWLAQFQLRAIPFTDEAKRRICSALYQVRSQLIRLAE